MKRKNGWFLMVVLLLAVAGIFLIVFYFQQKNAKQRVGEIKPVSVRDFKTTTQEGNNANEGTKMEAELPSKFLLDVPFQPQAPYGDWSQPYQDACEEAALVIVEHYLEGKSLSKTEMKSEIDASVSWQEKNWGGHLDLDATKTLQLAKEYFGLSGKVIKNYRIVDLKRYLLTGSPIVVPAAGRLLGNPNFTDDGPEYHMLVIIGYNDETGVFITNDPGTRKGESYTYKYQTLIDAISSPNMNMEKSVIVLGQ